MTPGMNNQFHISSDDFGDSNLPSTEQNRLSGRYSFSGPTESIEGTFSVSPPWNRANTDGVIIIDTTDYPNGVTLDHDPFWWTTYSFNLITETIIDGVDISVGMNSVVFRIPHDFQFNQAPIIPEPSTYALTAGGILLAFIAFRRMRTTSPTE